MTTDEQRIAERQNELLKKRRAMIEHGILKSLQPLPDDPPTGAYAAPSNLCPACGQTMSWYPARQAFLCVRDGCQPW